MVNCCFYIAVLVQIKCISLHIFPWLSTPAHLQWLRLLRGSRHTVWEPLPYRQESCIDLLSWLSTRKQITAHPKMSKHVFNCPPYYNFCLCCIYSSKQLLLPGVRRMTERMTRDITARITTIAIPMPFQFRGGPSELPRSWYEQNKHTNTTLNVCTAEGEDISAASFP